MVVSFFLCRVSNGRICVGQHDIIACFSSKAEQLSIDGPCVLNGGVVTDKLKAPL